MGFLASIADFVFIFVLEEREMFEGVACGLLDFAMRMCDNDVLFLDYLTRSSIQSR